MIGQSQDILEALVAAAGAPINARLKWGPSDGWSGELPGAGELINFNQEPYLAYKIQGNELLYTWVIGVSPIQSSDNEIESE